MNIFKEFFSFRDNKATTENLPNINIICAQEMSANILPQFSPSPHSPYQEEIKENCMSEEVKIDAFANSGNIKNYDKLEEDSFLSFTNKEFIFFSDFKLENLIEHLLKPLSTVQKDSRVITENQVDEVQEDDFKNDSNYAEERNTIKRK